MLGQKVTPLNRVGVYVPGGKAVYPSSVLMNIVPAKVAGVPHIVMTTPPGKDGKVCASTLVAAKEAGADEIYKVGGAQAIGALAFGTESIPKVDKIVGPGNIFVALAKKAVYGYVSIDSIAGPSEILVLADAADGHGMVDEPHCPVGVIGGGDDAGVRLHGQQLRVHLSGPAATVAGAVAGILVHKEMRRGPGAVGDGPVGRGFRLRR